MSLSNDTNMVMPVMPTYGMGMGMGYGMGMGGMWGNDWFAWIIILLLFGNRGWGNNSCDSGSSVLPYLLAANNNNSGCGCCAPATCQELQAGFNNQAVMNKLNGLENGLSSLGYDQLNQMNGINTNIFQTGYTVRDAVQQNTVAGMQNTNAIQSQIADCCCENRLAICNLNNFINQGFNGISNTICNSTRDVIDNQNANYRALSDQLIAFRMEDKDNQIRSLENQVNALNLAQSQANQNNVFGARVDAAVAEILRRTGHDCPTAAYVVQPPQPVTFPNYCNPCGSCGV